MTTRPYVKGGKEGRMAKHVNVRYRYHPTGKGKRRSELREKKEAHLETSAASSLSMPKLTDQGKGKKKD